MHDQAVAYLKENKKDKLAKELEAKFASLTGGKK
jgi:hypothetical protein